MANPRSLCWAIELFAYGVLGMVTWLVAPTFREERAVALLLRANGVVSVACAAVALFDLTWVQSPIGLAFYAAWNLLVVVLMVLVARNFRSAPGGALTASPQPAREAEPGPGGQP
jgi:Na+/alanine symporter